MGKIVFLGVEGSGKTSLSMALLNAFKRHRDEGWYLSPKSRDAFAFTERLPEVFSVDNFPSSTSSLRTLSWELEYCQKKIHEVSVFDYPGELFRQAFLDGRLDMADETFNARITSEQFEIRNLLDSIRGAERVYVLLNLDDAVNLRNNARNIDAVWATNECLKFVERLPEGPTLTLLFTQVDRYGSEEEIQDKFRNADFSLIAHDHPNLKWKMVSVLVPFENKFGVDQIVQDVVQGAFAEGRLSVIEELNFILDIEQWTKMAADIFKPSTQGFGFVLDGESAELLRKSLQRLRQVVTNSLWLLNKFIKPGLANVRFSAADCAAVEAFCNIVLSSENKSFNFLKEALNGLIQPLPCLGAELAKSAIAKLNELEMEQRDKYLHAAHETLTSLECVFAKFDPLDGEKDRLIVLLSKIKKLLKKQQELVVAGWMFSEQVQTDLYAEKDLVTALTLIDAVGGAISDGGRKVNLDSLRAICDKAEIAQSARAYKVIDNLKSCFAAIERQRRTNIRRAVLAWVFLFFVFAGIILIILLRNGKELSSSPAKSSSSSQWSSAESLEQRSEVKEHIDSRLDLLYVTIEFRVNNKVPDRVVVGAPNMPRQETATVELRRKFGSVVGPFDVYCMYQGRFYYHKFTKIDFDWTGGQKMDFVFTLEEKDRVTFGEKYDLCKYNLCDK